MFLFSSTFPLELWFAAIYAVSAKKQNIDCMNVLSKKKLVCSNLKTERMFYHCTNIDLSHFNLECEWTLKTWRKERTFSYFLFTFCFWQICTVQPFAWHSPCSQTLSESWPPGWRPRWTRWGARRGWTSQLPCRVQKYCSIKIIKSISWHKFFSNLTFVGSCPLNSAK